MDINTMVVGKRYMLPHGPGTFKGWEQFDKDGMTMPCNPDMSKYPHSDYWKPRLCFTIDSDTEWSQLMDSTNYAIFSVDFDRLTEITDGMGTDRSFSPTG